MRKRLLESAMLVFAQKGVGASVIADVVAAAEVSQGSFYNHFRTNEELLLAVAKELDDEIVGIIEAVVGTIDDPARRVAIAIRSYLHLNRSYRVVARFLSSAGLQLADKGVAARKYLPDDLAEGQVRRQFELASIDVAVDLINGACLMAVHRMASGRTARDYPEKVTTAILRSLGLGAAATARLTALPLPKFTAAPDSLFARAQARLSASREQAAVSSAG